LWVLRTLGLENYYKSVVAATKKMQLKNQKKMRNISAGLP
jgi:hypothetical protein